MRELEGAEPVTSPDDMRIRRRITNLDNVEAKVTSHYGRDVDRGNFFHHIGDNTISKGGKKDSLDDTLETLRKVLEIKKITKELSAPLPRQPFPWIVAATDPASLSYNSGSLEKLLSMTFSPETDPLRHRIIGFTCLSCRACMATIPLALHGFEENRKIVTSNHACNPGRVVTVQNFSKDEKYSVYLKLHESYRKSMIRAIQEWWLDDKMPHLIVIPLRSVTKNLYDFTSYLEGGYKWLSKVIAERHIVLDNNDLYDLLLLTRGNTYANFFIRQRGVLGLQSFFMTLSKGPSLPFSFTIENPIFPSFPLQ